MAVMSYGISDSVQKEFSSPKDLKDRALFKFKATPLWYAVAFPKWNGYRIEHDPVYTGYTSFSVPETPKEEEKKQVCFGSILVLVATTAVLCIIGWRKR